MDTPTPDQRRRFEWLCFSRALYERRGPRDSVGVMTVSEAIRYVETLLTAGATLLPGADARSADSTV